MTDSVRYHVSAFAERGKSIGILACFVAVFNTKLRNFTRKSCSPMPTDFVLVEMFLIFTFQIMHIQTQHIDHIQGDKLELINPLGN